MQTPSCDISIILVNYKTPQLLLDCISSILLETKAISYEIIVVDNDSQDDSEMLVREQFSTVRWINTGYNAGFARANNIGISMAKGQYCLMLNSDTIVKDAAVEKSLSRYKKYEETVNIGLLGCKIIHFDGYMQFNSNTETHIWGKLIKANALYILLGRLLKFQDAALMKKMEGQRRQQEHVTEHETLWLGGAFLLFNTSKIVGQHTLLDEDFFMYSEDEEWCLRLKKLGYHHFFYPDAYILHAEGGSFTIKESKYKQIILSEWLLVLKLYGRLAYLAFIAILIINLVCDDILHLRSRSAPAVSDPDTLQQAEIRRWKWQMIRQYTAKVFFRYASRPSSATHYLKNGQ